MIDVHARFLPSLSGFFDEPVRHYVLYGGRGSGKSWDIAQNLVLWCIERKERVLCCREFQTSIRQSVKQLLENTIDRLGVRDLFVIRDNTIICPMTGSDFLFTGLWNNYENIKSTEGITIAWIEEAQTVSEKSVDVLIPTVRGRSGAFLIYSMNPRFATDYVYKRFVAPEISPDNTRRIMVNWRDNPWFPDVLHEDMLEEKKVNFAKYLHIWEGELLVDDEALVFRHNVREEAFDTPSNAEFMFGADFGFSNDPSTLVRSFIPKPRELFIDWDIGRVGVEIDDHPEMYDKIPESRKYPIIADSARPETISYLHRKGFSIKGAVKGKGSVEDGISWLQSQSIVIHPRCQETLIEFKTHKFKRHAQTDEITRIPEDANNHYIDATRYAWENRWLKSRVMVDA